jgi:hypothetical protein
VVPHPRRAVDAAITAHQAAAGRGLANLVAGVTFKLKDYFPKQK